MRNSDYSLGNVASDDQEVESHLKWQGSGTLISMFKGMTMTHWWKPSRFLEQYISSPW